MSTFSLGDVALAVGVSASTIRNWTDEEGLQSLLSDLASRTGTHSNAKERRYTENDLYVLHTVNKRKTRHTSWEEVADHIREKGYDTDLPASASLVLPTAAADFSDKIILRQQLDIANTRIEELKGELEQVRDKSKQEVEEVREKMRQRELEYVKHIARLEMRIEMLEEQAEQSPDTED